MTNKYRYGQYHEGPDPLAPPYEIRQALDEIGDDVLAGSNPSEALRDMLRRGTQGLRGLDDMARQVRKRQRELRNRGRLDGTLEEARRLLDTAVGQERAGLFPDPSDDARMREAELDELPDDTSRAVSQLADYEWRSDEARQTFQQLQDMLRRDVLDAQFRGMKDALQGGDEQSMQRVTDMLSDLNDMLDADARGEHTQDDFDRFMEQYGDFFPDNPENLDELVDELARRAAATQQLLESLTPEQREELAGLMQQAMQDAGLAEQMGRLSDALRARRPDLDWDSPQQMRGEQPLGMGDATTALAELADLGQLESALGQNYAGARLDDIDEEAVRRALGRRAVDDVEELRRIERELERQGYLQRSGGELELTPKAVRRLGETALRRVFTDLDAGRRGEHDLRDAGAGGEPTGASRPWQFGDEQPLDVVRTVGNAVRRAGPVTPVRLGVEDFEVAETERRSSAAVCLLVDLSYSMILRDAWGPAKQTALALHQLVTSRYPQDAVEIIGFSNYARHIQPAGFVGLEADMVQGTNLHHALMLAGRHLDRHPESDPVVLVVTDGEPTAHLTPGGGWWFDWPPAPETIELTLAEVDKMTRRGAALNVFMLADDERLEAFVEEVGRRNGGRVFSPSPERLGEYVVSDFMRRRQGGRRRAA